MKTTCVVTGLIGSYLLGGVLTAMAAEKIAPKTLQFLEATTISGYVQSSYQKSWGAKGTAGDPGTTPARFFNNNRNGFDIDQAKLTLEKPIGDGEAGAGYRVDLLYGRDASRITGNNNSFFLEQAYVQFRLPVGTGVDVKMGRFTTLVGYEVIDAPANWNYSRSFIYSTQPFTHTGALLSYKWNDIVDTQFGVVNGYSDTAGVNGAADNNSGKSITGRLGVTLLGGQLVLSTIGIAGAEHAGNNNGTRWVANEVITYNPKWNEKWTFALEGIYGRDTRMDMATGVADTPEAMWWGVAGYTKYQWLPHFSTALRAESLSFNGSAMNIFGWGGAFTPATLADFGAKGHVESLTMSCAFDNIWKNLTPRLEVRYDRADPAIFGNATDGFNHNGIFTASLDIIYAF
ncbi:MAG: porin [Verrucomicrobia bacterium]|nr:porin [Verrucomicrobiota bacterium]